MGGSRKDAEVKSYWDHSGRWKRICHWGGGTIRYFFAKKKNMEDSRETQRRIQDDLILKTKSRFQQKIDGVHNENSREY